jgi:2-iminoacetate synthase
MDQSVKQFSEHFNFKEIQESKKTFSSESDFFKILHQQPLSFLNFLSLLMPENASRIKPMAIRAQQLTIQRFGKTIQFFVPLYLSNECKSVCVYCGFSNHRAIKRATLDYTQIEKNFEALKGEGFDHVLLLTGEDRHSSGVSYLVDAIQCAKKYFSFVGIEVFPMSVEDYARMAQAGADHVVIYQETYHPETYSKMHLAGEKKNYHWRLDAPERALEAGFRKVGLGTLLGLHSNWRFEVIALAKHLDHLRKKFWRGEFTLSFPRINPESILSKVPYPVSEKELIWILSALRLYFPEVGFVLSTRESQELRDHLIDLCITQMSAGSKTNPGGYTGEDSTEQFAIKDERSLSEMIRVVSQKGYDPIIKDWAPEFSSLS